MRIAGAKSDKLIEENTVLTILYRTMIFASVQ